MILTNNTILITGGTRGIGLAMAKVFLNNKNRVIITGRSSDQLRLLEEANPGLIGYKADLTSRRDLNELASSVQQNYPELNVLINNAGIQYNYDLQSGLGVLDKIEHEIGSNLIGPIQLSVQLIPILKNNAHPTIINISSALAFAPKYSSPIYNATKAGIHVYSIAAREQLKDIDVIEVYPPLVDTDMTKGRGSGKITPEKFADLLLKQLSTNQTEIYIGKTKLLRAIYRMKPSLARLIINRGG